MKFCFFKYINNLYSIKKVFLKIACDQFVSMKNITESGDIVHMRKFNYQHFNNQILVENSLDKDLHDWVFMLELRTALFGSIKKYRGSKHALSKQSVMCTLGYDYA